MDELEQRYNKLLERYNKASKYMDCHHLNGEKLTLAVLEREKHLPEYRKIIKEIGELSELMAKKIMGEVNGGVS